jgi:Rod binding domain-containing protein
MAISPISSTSLSTSLGIPELNTDSPKNSPERIKDAASQFEALLMGQIMKAAHQNDGDGWGGEEADQASATAMDFANDYFARSLASTGGLGLSKMIVEGLTRQSATRSNPATTTEPSDSTPASDR